MIIQGRQEPWTSWDTLWNASRRGDVNLVRHLLIACPTNNNNHDHNDDDNDCDDLIVNSNDDDGAEDNIINMVNTSGENALMIASRCKHHNVVELLLQYGAKYEMDNRGNSPGSIAVTNHDINTINILCKHKVIPKNEVQDLMLQALASQDHEITKTLYSNHHPSFANLHLLQNGQHHHHSLPHPHRVGKHHRKEMILPACRTLNTAELCKWLQRKISSQLSQSSPSSSSMSEDYQQLIMRIRRSELDGRYLTSLSRDEAKRLLKFLALPLIHRQSMVGILAQLHDHHQFPVYELEEMRLVGILAGNPASFRLLKMIRASSLTTLAEIRHQHLVNLNITEGFVFPHGELLSCGDEDDAMLCDVQGHIFVQTNVS